MWNVKIMIFNMASIYSLITKKLKPYNVAISQVYS